MRSIKIFIFLVLLNCLTLSFSNSEIIEKIKIEGNKRITDEIILMFSGIDVGERYTKF